MEAERLVLQTFADNEDGRAFYRARGFEVDGKGSYEEDRIVPDGRVLEAVSRS